MKQCPVKYNSFIHLYFTDTFTQFQIGKYVEESLEQSHQQLALLQNMLSSALHLAVRWSLKSGGVPRRYF